MSALAIYDQEKLSPEARDAALAAANAALEREGISARGAVKAASVDLLLAEGLEPDERTDEHYEEHGASLRACEAYGAAKDAAEREIARLAPELSGFVVLFSVGEQFAS